MSSPRSRYLFIVFSVVSLFVASSIHAVLSGYNEDWDLEYILSGGFKPETFYGENITLINDNNCEDRVWFARHTLDMNIDVLYGKETYGHSAAEFMFTLRNRSVWGNRKSLGPTTRDEIKFLSAVGQSHRHNLPFHFLWMRELWVRFSLNDLFGFNACGEHTFTIGAFPFELGRGISLGAAFAVGPELLGFYTDSAINQFAFGAKFSGELRKDILSYDLYGAILDNKASSVSDTGARIYGQEFGRIANPIRGFGKVAYLVAGRLVWFPLHNDPERTLVVEPYMLYGHAPEQKLEFLGDAKADLGTFGLACDYLTDCFEVGFEFAKNIGSQKVKGWDRNVVELQNRNGNPVLVNSQVVIGVDPKDPNAPFDLSLYKVPHTSNEINGGTPTTFGKDAQDIINLREIENENQNGRLIGTVSGFSAALPDTIPDAVAPAMEDQLYNTNTRFRNPYKNEFKGYMFVADAAWIPCKDLKLAVAVGIASGDDNPNFTTRDGDFAGFIGLQEIYSGKRVRSAFLLGGSGRLERPLSAPLSPTAVDPFARTISGFTNLIYTGTGLNWKTCCRDHKITFNPNVIGYWDHFQTPKFDIMAKKDSTTECARSYLGAEINLFLYADITKNINVFFVGAVFLPGGHFSDIKGKPLNKDQLKRLDRLDRTGFNDDLIPNLGDDIAYTLNAGVTFKF